MFGCGVQSGAPYVNVLPPEHNFFRHNHSFVSVRQTIDGSSFVRVLVPRAAARKEIAHSLPKEQAFANTMTRAARDGPHVAAAHAGRRSLRTQHEASRCHPRA